MPKLMTTKGRVLSQLGLCLLFSGTHMSRAFVLEDLDTIWLVLASNLAAKKDYLEAGTWGNMLRKVG